MAETTGIINGSNLKITLAAVGGSEVMVNNLTDCSISTNVDMRDTTTKSGSTPNPGDMEFEAKGYITSLDLTGGTEDNATFSCSVQLVETIAYNVIA